MSVRSIALTLLAMTGCDKWPTDAASQEPAQCVVDDDCALLPSELTCCDECPPTPPFRAAPVEHVDAIYIENEHRCIQTEISCPETKCEPLPAGCTARAVCAQGRCIARATGCAGPTS